MDNFDLALSILDDDNWVDVSTINLKDKFNVEKNHVKRQAFSALSFEAKFMIGLVVNPPDYVQFQIRKKNSDRISLTRLNKFLRRKGWRWAQIQSARSEITDYVKDNLC